MAIRVGINGFGRIGRNFFRAARQQASEAGLSTTVRRWWEGETLEFVAVNDLGSIDTMAHLLRRDSIYGPFPGEVTVGEDTISVDGEVISVLAEREPKNLPWGDLGVEVVIESTGLFTSRDAAAAHLEAGAPVVIVSAPSSGADASFVVGVNDDTFDSARHKVVSGASCTTNCFVPMVKVLDDAFGVDRGLMTTVHAYTGDQMLVDGPHKDSRRARAAAINIVPTSTGAARSTGLVLQAMQGKLDGIALRVPVADGSITDFVAVLGRDVTADEVNAAFEKAATDGALASVLEYSEEPLVSADIIGSAASCTFDSQLTVALGDLVKVAGWYDNEWGYSNRLVDLARIVGSSTERDEK